MSDNLLAPAPIARGGIIAPGTSIGWKSSESISLVGNNGYSKSENEQTYSYRTHQFRLIRYGNGKKELYDHYNDPHEWQNIANNKKNKKLVRQLNSEMDNILINR